MSALPSPAAGFASVCNLSIRRTFSAHLPLYVCAFIFVPATIAVTYAYNARLSFGASLFFLTIVPQFTAVGLFIAAVVQFVRLVRAGSRSPLRDFGAWAYVLATSHDRPGNVFHTVVTITPLMVSFTALKEIVPVIRPFAWDQTFEHWDRVLGFGHMPWELLQPLLGYPPVTYVINLVYGIWFTMMFATLIWQACFARGTPLRMQFLLAFSFSWFLAGNVLAVLFSSAGPCFYGFLYSPDPYAAQMAYLNQVNEHWPIGALRLQNLLWTTYAETHGANIGISAMPSMHVVIAVLMALITRRTNRWLGLAFTVYAAVIVIGSVHLAWHYAVDSIGGIALALSFWWLAGAILKARARMTTPALSEAVSSAPTSC